MTSEPFQLEGNFGLDAMTRELAEQKRRREQREALALRQSAPLTGASDLAQSALFHEDANLFSGPTPGR